MSDDAAQAVQAKGGIKTQLLWITTLGQASVALYLPALPEIAKELGVSSALASQTITAYVLGLGFSPMFYGPISDRVGRKAILIFSLALALLGYLLNIAADEIRLFILARLIQGLGCGGLLIVGRAIVRDVFSGRELSSAASYLSMGFAIGFGISPIVGGLLIQYQWRYNFAFLVVMCLLLLGATCWLMPETLKRPEGTVTKLRLSAVARDYRLMLTNPRFLRFILGGFFAYGVVLAYNVMTPFLIQNAYKVSPRDYSHLALLMGIPYYLAASFNRQLVLRYGAAVVSNFGTALIFVGGAVIVAFTLLSSTSLYALIVPMMLATFGQAFVFSNTISGAMQEFSADRAGKASALFTSLQMLLASLLSYVMASLPNTTPLSIGSVVLFLGLFSAIVLPKSVTH